MTKLEADFESRHQALSKKFGEHTDLIEGSLFMRIVNGQERIYLSRMVAGVQRQVYISKKHLQKVQQGIKRWQNIKQIVHELSELNIAIIQQEQ
jgi:hypothetical protein